jgi:hypothetical protein
VSYIDKKILEGFIFEAAEEDMLEGIKGTSGSSSGTASFSSRDTLSDDPSGSSGGSDAASRAEYEYLNFWGSGKIKATQDNPRLSKYWQNCRKSSDTGVNQPWSGAFICWVMSGISGFIGSALHAKYMSAARKNRKLIDSGQDNGEYAAFKPGEIAPSRGDIVCRPRGGSGDGWDNIGMTNHCDIYVGNSEIIGGNVNRSVTKKPYNSKQTSMIITRRRPSGAALSEDMTNISSDKNAIRNIISDILNNNRQEEAISEGIKGTVGIDSFRDGSHRFEEERDDMEPLGSGADPLVAAYGDALKSLLPGLIITSNFRTRDDQARVSFQYPFAIDTLIRRVDARIQPGDYFLSGQAKEGGRINIVNAALKSIGKGSVTNGVYGGSKYRNIMSIYRKYEGHIQSVGRNAAPPGIIAAVQREVSPMVGSGSPGSHLSGQALDLGGVSGSALKKAINTLKANPRFSGYRIIGPKLEADHFHVGVIPASAAMT